MASGFYISGVEDTPEGRREIRMSIIQREGVVLLLWNVDIPECMETVFGLMDLEWDAGIIYKYKDESFALMLEEKNWNKNFEKEIYERWAKTKRQFKGNKTFSIDTPPPYVNTPIHVGHAATYVLMDMFARYRRMKGYNILFPLGLDRNGLPIEMEAEKKFRVKLSDISREKFLELCKSVLDESSHVSLNSFLRLGICFNSWQENEGIGDLYCTDSESYRKLTQNTFIDLWNRGLIYEAKRINNYCPGCRTTIADAEVVYEERKTYYNDIVFKVKETGEEIVVGTTRPELICTCAMICYNPKDERYKHLEGKTAITPIYEEEVELRAHPIAKMEKGTGLVMMCSMGDLTDVRFFRELNLKPEIAIDIDGRMNERGGFLEGLKIDEARKRIVEELNDRGLLKGRKKIMHPVPICERSEDPIEFIEMDELYLKQLDFKDDMKEIAKEINFHDENSRNILLDWIDSITMDWPISRRRYYATEIPLWYCKTCKKPIVPEKGRYYRPWAEKPPFEECPFCHSREFEGETRVLDTWFDSSSSILYVLGYGRNKDFFEKNFPCTLRPQGKEIIRNWLYYTLLKTYLLTGKKAFEDVWINYHIVDDKGKKMSKSKGNMIKPEQILDLYGAEPFRLWCALEGNLTKDDFRCSFERIAGAKKTLTKLWNVAKFITNFEPSDEESTCPIDKVMVKETNRLIDFCDSCYENYDFHDPAVKIREFIWETFASHYLEMVKSKAYNDRKIFSEEERKSAISTLYRTLKVVLKLLRPTNPFITEKIYKEIWSDGELDIFPETVKEKEEMVEMADLMELNHTIWKEKKDRGLSLKDGVKKLILPEKFRPIEKDIVTTHGVEKLEYGNEIKVLL
jgi:Valyl-tRNA synthetase